MLGSIYLKGVTLIIAGWLHGPAVADDGNPLSSSRALGDPRDIDTIARIDTGLSMSIMILDLEDFALNDNGPQQYEGGAEGDSLVGDMLDDKAFGFRLLHKF